MNDMMKINAADKRIIPSVADLTGCLA